MGIPEQQSLFPLLTTSLAREKTKLRSARSGTFTDNMKLPVHRWFRYSAGFSAEWAEQLIRERAPSVVLDPFAGSGTTLLASQAVGVTAYGYESHPFVARIATAKTYWNQSEALLLSATTALLKIAKNAKPPSKYPIPELLLKCYTPEALQQLYSLRHAHSLLAKELEPKVTELLWLSITAILRVCSFAGTAQWQYILPNKRKATLVEPFAAFEHKVAEMAIDMAELKRRRYSGDASIILHDARDTTALVEPDSVDLVVTSPPYPNNYDYADATRLEMTFWGEIGGWGDLQKAVRQFIIRSCSQHTAAEKLLLSTLLEDSSVDSIRNDLSAVCNELAEVRKTKGGKKSYHTMVAAYFSDLSKVFRALRGTCKSGSSLCFVIGDSAPYGVYVPADKWLETLAISAGFKSCSFEKLRDRNVKWKNRKHRVPLLEGRLWIRG